MVREVLSNRAKPIYTPPNHKILGFSGSSRISATLPKTSYLQGLISSPLHELFSPALVGRLRAALSTFDRRLKGFMSAEALLVAVESRTSAPVRIPRDADTLMHPQVKGLFPCGEGSGYAGGITSSALDGQRVAVQVSRYLDRPIKP